MATQAVRAALPMSPQPAVWSSAREIHGRRTWQRAPATRAAPGRLPAVHTRGRRGRPSWVRGAANDDNDNKGGGDTATKEKADSKPATDANPLKKEPSTKSVANQELEKFKSMGQEELDGLKHAIGSVLNPKLPDTPPKEPLNLAKLKEAFSWNTFSATDAIRYGSGGIFPGNLRKPLAQVQAEVERKLEEKAGRPVYVWWSSDKLVVVQPQDEVDVILRAGSLSSRWGWVSAIVLGVATTASVASLSSAFMDPELAKAPEEILARLYPLMLAFGIIVGASEVATRLVSKAYGVKLSPTLLIPSGWVGCLGAVNNYESILPNRNALFDIPAARAGSAFVVSLLLAATAFYFDHGTGGGAHPLYLKPGWFVNNPLVSFIQYVTGPYFDDLGNVLPQAVEGKGVPINPMALGGLLGMVVSSINLLPSGRLDGGRIVQALWGRRVHSAVGLATNTLLGIGGLSGSVLCLTVGFITVFFRGGDELPVKDEITPVGTWRYFAGAFLGAVLLITLFPNSAGTFPSAFYVPPYLQDLLGWNDAL